MGSSASVDQNEPAGGRLVTDFEQVLDIRVAQERFGIFAQRELDDDHAFRCPITLDRCRWNSANDIFAGMSCDVRGDFRDVSAETGKVVDREIEHQISLQPAIPCRSGTSTMSGNAAALAFHARRYSRMRAVSSATSRPTKRRIRCKVMSMPSETPPPVSTDPVSTSRAATAWVAG